MTGSRLPAPLLSTGPDRLDQPVLIYCDDATGERTELSARALSGWAARTAGLLHAGCGLDVGDRAAVLLPPHWQTAGVLLGAWAAGVSVSIRLWGPAGLSDPGDQPLDASFVSAARLRSLLDDVPPARHRFVLELAPAPSRRQIGASDGYRDYLIEARRFTDALPAAAALSWNDAATVDGTTYRDWGALAAELAAVIGLRRGDRLLVDVAEHEHPVEWLLAPLAAGASVVLCAHLDRSRLDARIAAENITHVL